MNERAMNVAIAEACGWERKQSGGCVWYETSSGVAIYGNIVGDLNAMHEAELSLDEETYKRFCSRMLAFASVYGKQGMFLRYTNRDLFSPTARQRAEAFLRTIGRWVDA